VLEIRRQLLGDGLPAHADLHFDCGLAEASNATAANQGIGVLDADHDPSHARVDQGVGTRWRPAVVGARLEGYVHGRALGRIPGHGEGDRLGVEAPGRLRSADGGRFFALGNDHASDPRVGRCSAPGVLRGRHRFAHEGLVLARCVGHTPS